MKKLILSSIACLAITLSFSQSATNWTANDCAGSPHTLFTELDAGKVVVICWVMPCGACIPAALTAANTVIGFANPKVVFYLCDDYADNSCSTIASWASSNSIVSTANFSNSAISMSSYGTPGMPKTVVLGASSHSVYFNQNGTITQSALQAAINSALSGGGTAIDEKKNTKIKATVFPNPIVSNAILNYSLNTSTDVSIEITNILGETVKSISIGKQSAGIQSYEINLESLSVGSYFIKLNTGESFEIVKVTITR